MSVSFAVCALAKLILANNCHLWAFFISSHPLLLHLNCKSKAKNASTAKGRNAIMQASNELLGFMGGELLKVRTLMLEQTKTYLDYAERERTLQDAASERLKKDVENMSESSYTPVKWSW